MRNLPNDLPPEIKPVLTKKRLSKKSTGKEHIELESQVREYQLDTPLFGGGVEAGKPDPVTPIRGSEVRGQLRFWWRACRGGNSNGKLNELREMEEEIWGSAATDGGGGPSDVDLVVKVTQKGKKEQPFSQGYRKSDQNWKKVSYAAFPLQGTRKEQPGHVLTVVCFELSITYPVEYKADIEAALWAWEMFGGIGGRTRRGFGALSSLDNTIPKEEKKAIENRIKEGLKQHVVTGVWPKNVPNLSHNMEYVITGPYGSSWEAWGDLISSYSRFRQSRNKGSGNTPGRSKWPEPDEIRRLTNSRSNRHAKALLNVKKFPRAKFGLPILFQFKDKNDGDPKSTQGESFTLQNRDYERLASPLILKPLSCTNSQSYGIALLLSGTSLPLGDLVLIGTNNGPAVVSADLDQKEAATIAPLEKNTDVFKAFFNYIKNKEKFK